MLTKRNRHNFDIKSSHPILAMALWCSCEDSVSWNKREIVDMEDLVQVWQKVSTYETIIKVNDSVKRLVVEFQSDSTKVKTITVERKMNTMIKSKIEARERAWEEAVRIAFAKKTVTVMTTDDIIRSAEKIANFLIGDAELPEINSKEEDVISSFIEALLKNIKTPIPDYMGLLRGNAELCDQIERRNHGNKK